MRSTNTVTVTTKHETIRPLWLRTITKARGLTNLKQIQKKIFEKKSNSKVLRTWNKKLIKTRDLATCVASRPAFCNLLYCTVQ